MFKISKKIEYTLITLKHMAGKTELTTAREISDQYKTPFDTTAKIMQILSNANILASEQGVKGGYTLNFDLSQLNYIQLTEIIEKRKFDFTCTGPKGVCESFESCNIKVPLTVINSRLRSFFETLSIAEILEIKIPVTYSDQRAQL